MCLPSVSRSSGIHSSHHSIMPAFEASHDTQKIKGGEDNESNDGADGGEVKEKSVAGKKWWMNDHHGYIWMMFSKIFYKNQWLNGMKLQTFAQFLVVQSLFVFFVFLSFSYEPSKVGWKLAALQDFPFETPEVFCNISQRQLRSRCSDVETTAHMRCWKSLHRICAVCLSYQDVVTNQDAERSATNEDHGVTGASVVL